MGSRQVPPWLRRLLALAVRAYPRRFRERFGPELREAVEHRFRTRSHAGALATGVWAAREVCVLVWHGVAERTSGALRRGGGGLRGTAARLATELTWSGRELIRSAPVATALIATLAVTLAVAGASFALLDGMLLRALRYADSDRLVAIWARHPEDGIERLPLTQWDVLELKARDDVFEAVGAYSQQRTALHLPDRSVEIGLGWLTSSTLEVLGIRPVLGRSFDASDQGELVVLLDHDFWLGHFGGDTTVVGRTLRIAQQSWMVIGVLPPATPLHLPAQGRVPARTDVWSFMWVENPDPDASSAWMRTVARLQPDVTPEAAQAIARRIAAESRTRFAARAQTGYDFDVVPLREDFTADVSDQLWLILGGSLVLLLAAAFNGGSLLMLFHLRRQHRTAILRALGADRGRLTRSHAFRILVLIGVASGLGGLGSVVALQGLLAWMPPDFPRLHAIRIDARAGTFMALLALLDALALFALSVGTAFHDRIDVGRAASVVERPRWGARVLVVQVAGSTVLLALALLLARSARNLSEVAPGFPTEQRVALRLALPNAGLTLRDLGAMAGAFHDRLSEVPGIDAVGAANVVPFDGGQWTGGVATTLAELSAQRTVAADFRFVTPGYLEALGLPVLAGELPAEGRDEGIAVVDQRLAELLWPNDPTSPGPLAAQPLGGEAATFGVAAVVGPALHASLRDGARPTVYFTSPAYTLPYVTTVVHTTLPAGDLLAHAREVGREVHPDFLVAEARPLDDLVAAAAASAYWLTRLVALFACTASAITLLGVYAVVSHTVRAQQREIGVRRVLGAEPRALGWMVTRQVLWTAVIGGGFGVVGGAVGARWIRGELVGVSTLDPGTYGLSVLIVAACAVAASALPAVRAMRVDPAEELRADG